MAWTTPSTAVAGSTALTAAFWNEQVRDNTNALYTSMRRIGYQERSSNLTITASLQEIFAQDITWTADGTSAYLIEFYANVELAVNTNDVGILLTNGAGSTIATMARPYLVGANIIFPTFVKMYYTPSAGSTTINVATNRGGSANGLILAGSGYSNAHVAVYGPDLT